MLGEPDVGSFFYFLSNYRSEEFHSSIRIIVNISLYGTQNVAICLMDIGPCFTDDSMYM